MSYEEIETNEVSIDDSRGELAVGLKVPTSVKTPISYLGTLRKYKDIYNDVYKQMEVSNKLYRYDPIIGNAVDVAIDFAVTKVRPLPTGNKQLDTLMEWWFSHVNEENSNSSKGVYSLCQELALEWFTSRNAFPYNKWENVKTGKRTYKLPYSVNLINPQSIHIPEGPIAFGQEVIYLKYDSDLIQKLKSDGRMNPEAALIKQAVPRSVLRSIQNSTGFQDGIRLNPKYVTHLKRRAKGYQAWGIPYLSRCFSSASLLERLRELDESITTGLINLITVFKIGTDEFPADGPRLRKFASLISNPAATKTLVWAHDVEILQVGPDGKILQFKDKYKEAKADILIALGIPPVLMSMTQTGNQWVSILALVERLSHWRNTMSLWLEKTATEIAHHNGFNEEIKVSWERMNLTDEQAVKNLVLSFYDRGLITIKTTLDESGYDFERETNQKKVEKPIVKDFLPPELPFSNGGGGGRPNDGDPKMTKKVKKKDSTKSENTVDDKPQKKKRTPKGADRNKK